MSVSLLRKNLGVHIARSRSSVTGCDGHQATAESVATAATASVAATRSAKRIGHEQNAHYRLAEDSRRQQSALVATRTANIIATYVLAAATAPAARMSTKASGSPMSSTTM